MQQNDCPDCVGTVLSISHNLMGSRRLDPKILYQSVARKVEKKPVCSGKMAERGAEKHNNLDNNKVLVGVVHSESGAYSGPSDDSGSQIVDFELSANCLAIWSEEDLKNMQENDVDICVILKLKSQFNLKLSKSFVNAQSIEIRKFWSTWESLFVINGILYFERIANDEH